MWRLKKMLKLQKKILTGVILSVLTLQQISCGVQEEATSGLQGENYFEYVQNKALEWGPTAFLTSESLVLAALYYQGRKSFNQSKTDFEKSLRKKIGGEYKAERKSVLQNSSDELAKAVEEFKKTQPKLEAEVKLAIKKLKDFDSRYSWANRNYRGVEQALKNNGHAIAEAEKAVSSLSRKSQPAMLRTQNSKTALAAARAKLSEATASLNRTGSDAAKARVEQYSRAVQALTGDSAADLNNHTKLQRKLTSETAKLKKLRGEVLELKKVASLQGNWDGLSKQRAALQADVNAGKAQYAKALSDSKHIRKTLAASRSKSIQQLSGKYQERLATQKKEGFSIWRDQKTGKLALKPVGARVLGGLVMVAIAVDLGFHGLHIISNDGEIDGGFVRYANLGNLGESLNLAASKVIDSFPETDPTASTSYFVK
jgi:hypothetical protein